MGLQEITLVLRNAEARVSELGPIRFLGIEQALGPEKMNGDAAGRSWQVSVREEDVCFFVTGRF